MQRPATHTHRKIRELFVGSTDNIVLQFVRYGFVGGIAFMVDYGTLFLLTDIFHVHHLISAAIAFILGLTVNYFMSRTWVFNSQSDANRIREFVVFALIGLVGLGMNECIMYLGTDVMGMHYMLSKLVSTSVVFIWNFAARKYMFAYK